MRMFEVEQLGTYTTMVTEVHNIEDASDVSYTEDEMRETFGSCCTGLRINSSLVKAKIEELRQIAFAAGQVSTLCHDADLIGVMVGHSVSASEYVQFARRVGNRFFFRTEATQAKKSRVVKHCHFRLILDSTMRIINEPLSGQASMHLKYAHEDKEGMLKLCARLVTIEQVEKTINECYKQYANDVDLVKQLWNDHSLILNKKGNKE